MTVLKELRSSLIESLEELGAVSRFLIQLVLYSPRALLRFDLIARQIFNSGALSLVIIMLSGLFVGMVLGLQGFQLLRRFGSEEALGTAAAIGLVRELGPVITALLFAGRAGTALASELGLMRATDQLSAMEMMAVDPIRRVVVPRFLGGVIAMPLLGRDLQRDRPVRRAARGRANDGRRFGQLLVADAGRRRRSGTSTRDSPRAASSASPAASSPCTRATTRRPPRKASGVATTRTVVTSAVVVLFLDYLLTSAFL